MTKTMRNLNEKDLVTLDECIIRLQQLWKLQEPPYSRRTLQNKLSRNVFRRYGPYRNPLVDWNEVREKELRQRCG